MIRRLWQCALFLCLSTTILLALLYIITRLSYRDTLPTRPQNVPATIFVQKDIKVQELRIRYIDTIDEGDRQVILFLHGHTSRLEENDEIMKIARKKFRVVAFDLPGSGYSDKPDREYSLVFLENITLDFLDALGINQCYYVGFSLGGNLGLRLAHRAPKRFLRLIIGAPGSAWPAKPVLAGVVCALSGPTLFWPFVKSQSNYWYRPDLPNREKKKQQIFKYYREIMSPGFIRMYWDMIVDQLDSSLFEIAGGINQPVILMWGDQDHGLGVDQGILHLSKIMPNAKLLIFKGVGHAIVDEKPKEVAEIIDQLFSE